MARQLVRESGKPIDIDSTTYRVNVQSLRRTGVLTEASAQLLDQLLDEGVVVDTDANLIDEGGRRERRHNAIERSAAVRRLALEFHGTTCSVCGFAFAEVYGPIGEGFAEVHHLKPLSATATRVRVDPHTDVVVLCANCHRMVHRRNPPLAPEELATLMRAAG